MWSSIIQFLSKNGLLLVIFGILVSFGAGLNALFPNWTILTTIFAIFRYLIGTMDWLIDTTTLITIIGLNLSLDILEWVLMAGLLPVDWFRQRAD